MPATQIAISIVSNTVGVMALVWVLARAARTGALREPLRGVGIPGRGPDLFGAVAVFGIFFLSLLALLPAPDAPTTTAPSQPATTESSQPVDPPGSEVWFARLVAQDIAKLVASGVALLLLAFGRKPSKRIGAGAMTAYAVVGLVCVLPIVELQARAGEVVIRWLDPGRVAPEHDVVLALHNSAWGRAGQLYLYVTAIVVAAATEEIFFRGLLLHGLRRTLGRNWLAILFSAGLFAGVHAQPQAWIPLTTLGLLLGYVRLRTGSLIPCILLHMLFNGRTMLLATLWPELIQQ